MNRTMTAIRQAILSSLLLLTAVAQADPAVPQSSTTATSYAVPPGDLVTALESFSKQSGVELVFQPDQVKGRQTKGVSGTFTTQDAVKRLLEGTDLRVQIDEKTGAMMIGSQRTASTDGRTTFLSPGERMTETEKALRLAQTEEQPQTDRSTPAASSTGVGTADAKGPYVDELEEVVVTGSRLRIGIDKSTSPVLIITREEIEKQGLATAADIIRSVPQNFSATNIASTTTTPGIPPAPIGSLGVSTANLFGLGGNATLVLVNGHRLASTPAFNADGQVDLSTIPAEAIERVEIVLDGASAVYGADAIGGVVNFILRNNFSGASSKLRADNGANGGNTWSASQTLGMTWSSGHVLAMGEYRSAKGVNTRDAGWVTSDLTSQGGTDWRSSTSTLPANVFGRGSLPASYDGTEDWTVDDLSFDNRIPYDTALDRRGSPLTDQYSATLSAEQAFGGSVKGYMDVLYSHANNRAATGTLSGIFLVPSTNPYNHVGSTVFVGTRLLGIPHVGTNTIERLNTTAGAEINLAHDWMLNLSGTYGTDQNTFGGNTIDPSIGQTANVFGNGTAQGDLSSFVQEVDPDVTKSRTYSFDAFADGTVFSTRGGDAKFGAGVQWRPQILDLSGAQGSILVNQPIGTKLKLTSSSAFVEGSIPFVGKDNALPGIRSLLLSVAGRYDEYVFRARFDGPEEPKGKRTFDKISPRVGLFWQPVQTVNVRGSWGRAFRSPDLLDLGEGTQIDTEFPVPTFDPATGEFVEANFGTAGNPNLTPEVSTARSLTLEWRPQILSGLMLSATYTEFNWHNRIQVEGADNPDVWPFLEQFPELIPRDLPLAQGGDGDPNTIDAALNVPINIARRQQNILSSTVSYEIDTTAMGSFQFAVTGVFTRKAEDRLLPEAPADVNLATTAGPDRTVLFSNFGWSRGTYGANLYGHFSSSYTNTFNALYRGFPSDARTDVASYTTFDLTGFYRTRFGLGINGGVKNLFDKSFPFYDSPGGPYDPSRVDPRGRTIYVDLRYDFKF